MEDELQEIQEGEIEALKSIFMDDFEAVESRTAWKAVNAAHEFKICVRPQEEDLKDLVHVKAHFKLPSRYPKTAPTMILTEPKGLSQADLKSLLAELQASAVNSIGAEMIYELVEVAAGFITDRHSNMERGKQTSLEEVRRQRAAEEAKAQLAIQRKADEAKARKDAEEASRLSMLIAQDVQRKEEQLAEWEKIQQDENGDGLALELGPKGEREATVQIWQGQTVSEARAKLGNATGGDWLGTMLPAEVMLLQTMAFQPPSFAATASVFNILAPYFHTPQGKRKLHKVEADIDRVRRLRHPNVLALHGHLLTPYNPAFFPPWSWSKSTTRSTSGFTLIVLTDPVNAPTLESLLGLYGELRFDRALPFFSQLVNAVEFLHSNNIIHRGIKPRAIWMGGADGGEIKLADSAWRQRLVDLNKADPWVVAPSERRPDSWLCQEAILEPFVYDRARDMFELGVVFAQMLFGLDVWRRFASPADLVRSIAKGSHPTIKKTLTDLLLTEAKKRITATKLVAQLLDTSQSGPSNGALATTPTNQTWIHHASGVPTPGVRPMDSPGLHPPVSRSVEGPSGFFWQPRATARSRYRDEFEELEFLGKGGGGQVVKARNRLDGSLYAVKKIRLPNDKAAEAKLLREVTIWSRMSHPNIVRYNSSWTEVVQEGEVDPFESGTEPSTQPGLSATDSAESRVSSTLNATSDDDDDSDDSDDSDETESDGDFSSDEDSAPGADLDIDLGLDDFDDSDPFSRGHSRSMSYPSIHFGADGDVSRAVSTAANSPARPSTRAPSPSPASTPMPKQTRTLYIQMEYVENNTLAEAINDGIAEVDRWRIMFQILSAMLHFTSLNIIHRDLKPSNIFLDIKGDVRIGDFGLAVNQGLADSADMSVSHSLENSIDDSDLTSGVGTSLYIAPETMVRGRGGKNQYSNKIDMYSLGIVFFELWHKFETGMERILVLRDLRKPEVVFPSTWDKVQMERHTKIIQACLAHDPEKRMSPRELLDSSLLPPRVGDDSVQETINLLRRSGNAHAKQLIAALFDQTPEDQLRKDFSYDFYDGAGAKDDPYEEIVRDKLSRIFRSKGAVKMDSPLLMPVSDIYDSPSRKPVKLLDADGTVAFLPYQLNIPLCRMVARDATLSRLKRWTIAPVFRAPTAGGQPRASLNAAFDIVSDASTAATEAECLSIVEEIMAGFPFDGETVHYLNHAKVLDAIVHRVDARPDAPDKSDRRRREAVLEILLQQGRAPKSWTKVSAELLKVQGVTRAMADDIGMVNVAGSLTEMHKLVKATVRQGLRKQVDEGFAELTEILKSSHQVGVRNVKISPLFALDWDFHKTGSLFATHHVRGKTREIVAAGGRFDSVVARLAAPKSARSSPAPHVVGFSLAVGRLSLAAAESNATAGKQLLAKREEHLRSYGPWAIRRADVYVVSFVPGLIDTRLAVVRDLWKVGIRADLAYDSSVSTLTPEQLALACRREGILYIVIVKGERAERTLKVKSVLRGYEEEVARGELVSWLADKLREQLIVDEQAGGGGPGQLVEGAGESDRFLPRHEHGAGARGGASKNQDFTAFLLDDDVRQKGRAQRRTTMINNAQKNVAAASAAAADAPVFTIDVDGPAFAAMTASSKWLFSDDTFRSVVHQAPLNKRDYLVTIRAAVAKKVTQMALAARNEDGQGAGVVWFWMFSLREDRSGLVSVEVGEVVGAGGR